MSVIDLRELTGGGAPAPGGRPHRSARRRALLIHNGPIRQ